MDPRRRDQAGKRLIEVLHIDRIEEVCWLRCVDRSLWVAIQIEADRRELVEEHERRRRVARSALGSGRIEKLL